MSTEQLFAGLTPEQEKRYTEEAARRWGSDHVRASVRKYQSYSAEKKARIAREGREVYRDIVAAMPRGANAPEVQHAIARWRQHLAYFWTPDDSQCLALARGYRDDPAFRKTFDAIHSDLANFMAEAVAVHVEGVGGDPLR